MAIDSLKTLDIIEVMENFREKKRPPEHIRSKLDVDYRIEGQSIIIVEVRPRWDNPSVYRDTPMAKTTYIKAKDHWKIFWMRQDLKWHSYTPRPYVKTLQEFTEVVLEDKHFCFWG